MKQFESFESNRWIWRVNILLQVLLVAALVVVVNLIGMTVWARRDLTKNRVASLSGEALNYVRDLDRRAAGDTSPPSPVEIIVTLTENPDEPALNQAYRDVRGILREFEYAARDNEYTRIVVRYLNVYRDRAEAEALGLADQPNVLEFRYRDHQPIRLNLSDLYTTSNRERNQFVGERAIAAALLDITSQKRPVLYFLVGHGEMQIGNVSPGRGASQLEAELRMRGYEIAELDLSAVRRVPDHPDRNSMVLILGPRTPLLRSEQEMLRDYLAREAGRVLLTLEPGREHGLEDLLYEWGILADDVLVVESDPGFRTEAGDLFVRGISPEHPITRTLYDARIPIVMPTARSVRPDPGRPLDDALVVLPLLHTSDGTSRGLVTSWGEINYRQPGPKTFDRGHDLPGPIFLATVAERRVDPELNVNVQGGRIVVFGSTDFLANRRIGTLGNTTLLVNAVEWAIDPERHINIPARPIERLKLTLSEQQLFVSGLVIILGPPLAVTVLGLMVYFVRRR